MKAISKRHYFSSRNEYLCSLIGKSPVCQRHFWENIKSKEPVQSLIYPNQPRLSSSWDYPDPFLFVWIDRTLMRSIHTGGGRGFKCHRPSLFLSSSHCLHFSRRPKVPCQQHRALEIELNGRVRCYGKSQMDFLANTK